MLTRKTFETVAGAIAETRDALPFPESIDALDAVAGRLADAFALENPRFDRDRFLRAAGAVCCAAALREVAAMHAVLGCDDGGRR